MITASDSYNTVDLGKYYAILPQNSPYSIFKEKIIKKLSMEVDVLMVFI